MMKKDDPKDGLFIPNEIAENIISNVPHGCGLINVALVCKRFKEMAWPHLFRTLRLRAEPMSDSDFSSIKWYEPPPGLASETFGRPAKGFSDICKYVQCLSVKVKEVRWYENIGGHNKLLNFLPALKELSLHPPPRHFYSLMSRQLEILRLDFSNHVENFWFPTGVFDTTPFDLNQYLSLPALLTLQIDHIQSDFHSGMINTGKPRSSTVTDLRLTDWPQDLDTLPSVLSSIRHLEHFILEAHGQWEIHRTLGPIHGLAPLNYGILLQPHSDSLKELIISYSNEAYDVNSRYFPRSASPVIGTLKDYPSLKRLAIPEPFLVGAGDRSFHSLLPPQLEELQFQHPIGISYEERLMDFENQPSNHLLRMKKLAENKQEFVPRLRHVVWWFQQTYRLSYLEDGTWDDTYRYRDLDTTPSYHDRPTDPVNGPPKILVELTEDFRKVGVKFEFVLAASFEYTPFAEYVDAQ